MSTPIETNTADLRGILDSVNALPEVSAMAVLYDREQNLSDVQKAQARNNIGALAESELNDAVTDALDQAKESGDFKGDPGAAGTSVTVSNVSESTADGGTNVVTFSDGKRLNVKNGSKGSDGAPGATGPAGYTPVKGTDYFTAADKQEIAQQAAALVPDDNFVVNIDYDAMSGSMTSDTTLDEIADAKEAGKTCVAKLIVVYEGVTMIEEYYYLKSCHREYSATFTGSPFHGFNEIYVNEGTNDASGSVYKIPWMLTCQLASGFQYLSFVEPAAASQTGQPPENSVLRNSKVSASEENPLYNGEICWNYE